MSKITIYAREVDGEVWEWARQKATTDRQSLARVVADALRLYRDHEPAQPSGREAGPSK